MSGELIAGCKVAGAIPSNSGDKLMLPLVVLNMPAETIVMAQATPVQTQSPKAFDEVIGRCQLVSNPAVRPPVPGILETNNLAAIGDARVFVSNIEHRSAHWESAQSKVLQGPAHGRLQLDDKEGFVFTYYIPDADYYGTDSVSFSVTVDGMRLKVVYSLHVVVSDDGKETSSLCPKTYHRIAYAVK